MNLGRLKLICHSHSCTAVWHENTPVISTMGTLGSSQLRYNEHIVTIRCLPEFRYRQMHGNMKWKSSWGSVHTEGTRRRTGKTKFLNNRVSERSFTRRGSQVTHRTTQNQWYKRRNPSKCQYLEDRSCYRKKLTQAFGQRNQKAQKNLQEYIYERYIVISGILTAYLF